MRPPWTKVGKKIESMTRKALFEYELIQDLSVAVALSGGKDSLTLLLMLCAISGRGFPPFSVKAIHVAGEFSCGAGIHASYLQKICDELNVELHVVQSEQDQGPLECYSCSRQRRRCLFDAAEKMGVATIAFGHHSDDSAQTLLMNLMHKGEFAANLPKLHMQDFGKTIIRPLIFVSEEQIRTFCKGQGLLRTMCQCPVGQNSMRKKVDHLLTELEQLFPNVRSNVARAGLLYGSDKAARKGESHVSIIKKSA